MYVSLGTLRVAAMSMPLGCHQSMTRVIPILFVLGFLWAPFALFLALSFFDGDQWNGGHILSLAAIAGFWVWFGWGWHCLTGRFPLVSARTFWSISLIVHLVWLGIFTWDGLELNSGIVTWIVPNVIVALVGLLPNSRDKGWKHKVGSVAAYGLPLAWAVLMAVEYAENIQSHLGAAHYWPLVIVVIALLMMVWCVPRQCDE
jgi:hypothetical protein